MKITRIHLLLSCFFIFSLHASHASIRNVFENVIILEEDSTFNQKSEFLLSGSYLVIGVFQHEANARKLCNEAKADGLNAAYKYHQENKLIYVYTHSGATKKNILNYYYQLRNGSEYIDAWILSLQYNQDVDKDIEKIKLETPVNADLQKAPIPEIKLDQENVVIAFQTMNIENQDPIFANIKLVDGAHASLIEDMDSDQSWMVNKRKTAYDTIQIITEAVGYRKTQVDVNLKQLFEKSDSLNILNRDDTIFVQIEMPSMEVGEYQVMYNTYFYGNSTVMRLQSKFELENVYNFLSSNPNMRIKLHGHTNGNSRGVAYLFLEEKKNFFEINRTKEYKKRGVSSTNLSQYRAETIKSYLVSRGIDGSRIETIGWGGKKMLYDADSPEAKNNIRVEIEVLSK